MSNYESKEISITTKNPANSNKFTRALKKHYNKHVDLRYAKAISLWTLIKEGVINFKIDKWGQLTFSAGHRYIEDINNYIDLLVKPNTNGGTIKALLKKPLKKDFVKIKTTDKKYGLSFDGDSGDGELYAHWDGNTLTYGCHEGNHSTRYLESSEVVAVINNAYREFINDGGTAFVRTYHLDEYDRHYKQPATVTNYKENKKTGKVHMNPYY